MEFTKDNMAALSLDAGKVDVIHFDDSMPGFGIRLRPSGKRSWIVQYRVNGRQRRETLGDVLQLDLKDARAAAKKRFALVALGGDPQGDKAAKKAQAKITLGALADRYLEVKKLIVRHNTYIADERYLTKYWKSFGSHPLELITRRAVALKLADITKQHGFTAAARARQTLSAFFSWTIREGIGDKNPVVGTSNPAAHIRSRERVLNAFEIQAICNALQADRFSNIIRLLLFTGARRNEIGGLKWSEVDLETGRLEISGARTKNHYPLRLQLPEAALRILQSLSRENDCDFIFGGRGSGPFFAWAYVKLDLDGRITAQQGKPLAQWRLHDIRRTVATGMAELGTQPHIIETILNHRGGHKGGIAGIYNRAAYEQETKRALTGC